MIIFLLVLGLYHFRAALGQDAGLMTNSTNSTGDMYVIHATVYQVGIITNKSDEEIANMTGNQEALTFYHTNGSTVDLKAIPAPLLTNVTAQSVVGVASAGAPGTSVGTLLDQLTSGKNTEPEHSVESPHRSTVRRSLHANQSDITRPSIKVVKETALIPPSAGLHSIGLPSLLGLNTSLTDVPVPIPNTSIVRYAKVNTVVQSL